MNRGVAFAIFKTINHEKWTDIERATAIKEVLNLETYNSITKEDFRIALKWLFDKCIDVEDQSEQKKEVASEKGEKD